MKINYQKLCEKQIDEMTSEGRRPRLLLQSCCGPCSSYVLEYLTKFFDITVLFYNPNIYPEEEYNKRLETQISFVENSNICNGVKVVDLPYLHDEFLAFVSGLENEPEGGARCVECFKVRMRRTAELALSDGYDCFATTLSVSPHKNAQLLNDIGNELSKELGIAFLCADFKKKEGYKRSIELSKEYNLYRQEYCGCEFSL